MHYCYDMWLPWLPWPYAVHVVYQNKILALYIALLASDDTCTRHFPYPKMTYQKRFLLLRWILFVCLECVRCMLTTLATEDNDGWCCRWLRQDDIETDRLFDVIHAWNWVRLPRAGWCVLGTRARRAHDSCELHRMANMQAKFVTTSSWTKTLLGR